MQIAPILGADPFPWQERLCSSLLAGTIPVAVDIPTGLGKTKVMALWLIALASGAPLPRRLVYVVDRRAVVDQASAEATEIAERFRKTNGDELAISTLRGQHVDSGDWREDPARPAVIVGTVDMIGSRLLFEGYGVSRRMRPMHAGLLGADTLVVLDEAHLAPPFRALIETVSTDPTLAGTRPLPAPRLRLMALSATQQSQANAPVPFGLDEDDRRHPEVARRLGAVKRLTVESLKATGTHQETVEALASALAVEAMQVADDAGGPVRIVVYCDSREVAELVNQKLAKGRSTILFTGARRVHERQQAADDLRKAGFLAGTGAAEATTFLVATSAGEVGVDLDADHAVMDLVPWERTVQRLGRVNRRGAGAARIRVVDPGLESAPSGASLGAVRRLLGLLPATEVGVLAGPRALADLAAREPSLVREASSPAPLRPELTRPLVEAWALTGLLDHTGRPEIEPWLRGWIDDKPQTRIVWRTHLPRRTDPEVRAGEVETFFAHARPHLAESLETETHRVRDWLQARAKALRGSAPGAELDRMIIAYVVVPDGGFCEAVNVTDAAEKPGKSDALSRVLAGRTLVVDAALGGLAETGLLDKDWDAPASTSDGTVPWPEVGFTIRQGGPGNESAGAACRFVTRFSAEGEAEAWLDVALTARQDTDVDPASRASRDVPLAEHAAAVEAEVRRIADGLGLETRWVELLATAARLHDQGKAAANWQDAMGAPRVGRPFAKTRGGGNPGLLMGYRHEFGSLLAAERDPAVRAMEQDDRDLVLHLIAAHHGGARPIIGVENCPEGPPTAMEAAGLAVALRFARLQKQWGPWGLAWWESLLRAADQAASREAG